MLQRSNAKVILMHALHWVYESIWGHQCYENYLKDSERSYLALMVQGLLCENSSKVWRDIIWFWRLFEDVEIYHSSHSFTDLGSVFPPFSFWIRVTTDHLLCGTRHLLSPVPCMATKINLRSANDRPVNVHPDKLYSLLVLSHTHSPQWVEVLMQLEKMPALY